MKNAAFPLQMFKYNNDIVFTWKKTWVVSKNKTWVDSRNSYAFTKSFLPFAKIPITSKSTINPELHRFKVTSLQILPDTKSDLHFSKMPITPKLKETGSYLASNLTSNKVWYSICKTKPISPNKIQLTKLNWNNKRLRENIKTWNWNRYQVASIQNVISNGS